MTTKLTMKNLQRQTSKLLTTLTICTVIGLIPCGADQTAKATSLTGKTMDALKELVSKGKEKLTQIASGDVTEVDRSMNDLQETVAAATERAKRLSEWNLDDVQKDAEKSFDLTIAAIQDYLDLVADDGPVHKAQIRIATAAEEQARVFREKAKTKSSERYEALAKSMDTQSTKARSIWDLIRQDRKSLVDEFAKFKESKELYVDVKKAQGIAAAVKELERVRDDLKKISTAMVKVQKAVLTETVAVTN